MSCWWNLSETNVPLNTSHLSHVASLGIKRPADFLSSAYPDALQLPCVPLASLCYVHSTVALVLCKEAKRSPFLTPFEQHPECRNSTLAERSRFYALWTTWHGGVWCDDQRIASFHATTWVNKWINLTQATQKQERDFKLIKHSRLVLFPQLTTANSYDPCVAPTSDQ